MQHSNKNEHPPGFVWHVAQVLTTAQSLPHLPPPQPKQSKQVRTLQAWPTGQPLQICVTQLVSQPRALGGPQALATAADIRTSTRANAITNTADRNESGSFSFL